MSENDRNKTNSQTQLDKFREAARDLMTDDDPERFAERVRKLAKAKPAPMGAHEKPKKLKGADSMENG